MIQPDLIAPCGMNCALCQAYQRPKNKCPGCRDDTRRIAGSNNNNPNNIVPGYLYNHWGVLGVMNLSVRFTIPLGAQYHHDLTSQLADGPVHIVGYSMGGMIGLEFAIRYLELVDYLVLISTDCRGTESIPCDDRVIEEMGKDLHDDLGWSVFRSSCNQETGSGDNR